MQQGAYKGFVMNKKNIIRDKNYLKFIRGLECVVCGNPHVEAAHLRMNTDGKKRSFSIDDPLMYESMQSLDGGGMEKMLTSVVGAPSNFL